MAETTLKDFVRADLVFPVPVPRPRQQVSAREAFLYLVMFSMLYVSSVCVSS